MTKSLIIGLGFGSAVYKPILENISNEVITFDLDISKNPNYTDLNELFKYHKKFDTVNICTPNFTHEYYARIFANYSNIIFVEKPGVVNADQWLDLVKDFPDTRFMVTKNNQYRDEIEQFGILSSQSSEVNLNWINNNRIPNPGSWFTDKEKSFGGVSKDLMPHLLSYFSLFEDLNSLPFYAYKEQKWTLEDCINSDYGSVNKDGKFDVDTFCEIKFQTKTTLWTLIADWRSDKGHNEVGIKFDNKNYELGLCPEYAYEKMILNALRMKNNNEFWNDQLNQDLFIHRTLDF